MPLILWVLTYFLDMMFWVWVVFFKGAEYIHDLELNFLNWLFFRWLPDEPVEIIKIIGWLALIGSTLWFIFGIFQPQLRKPWFY